MKTLFLLFLYFISLSGSSQMKLEWKDVFTSINSEVLQNSKAYSTLKDATTKIGHRLTGSENGKKAEQYAFDLLRSYGFDDVRFQPFEVESWSRGEIDVQVGANSQSLTKVKSVTLAHSPVSANISGDIIDMGNGLEADYQESPERAKGKIALVYLGLLPGTAEGSKNLHRSEKTALAIKYGAIGIIIINGVEGGVLLTGTASVTGKLIPIPAVCIGKEDGMQLKQTLQSFQQIARISMTNFSGKIKARNVIASIKGTKIPKEKIVTGGHLDSWDLATGAIDNGIGSFSILDMARTFKVLKLRPERTVEFVMFMGEEQGLLGSRAYIEQSTKDGSLQEVRFMLNYDMTNDPKGYASSSADMKDLFEQIGNVSKTLDSSFTNLFSSRAGLHSDHQPFMLQGIPTGGAAGGRLPNNSGRCYHADCDEFSLVDEMGLKNNVRFNSILLYGLADAAVIPAKRLSDEETKTFLIENNLKEPLVIAGEWRWKD